MSLEGNEGISFATRGQGNLEDKSQENSSNHKNHIKCFNCRVEGHYDIQCNEPLKDEAKQGKGDQGMAICITTDQSQQNNSTNSTAFLLSHPNESILKTLILLDNQSMIDLFCNPKLLTSIHESGYRMKVSCSAKSRITSKVGELQG